MGQAKRPPSALLIGLLEASSGRPEVLGFDTRLRRTRSSQMRALLEHNRLYERLSVEDNSPVLAHLAHPPLNGSSASSLCWKKWD
jgi:ABC-type multidrug transport system ATPase subunit